VTADREAHAIAPSELPPEVRSALSLALFESRPTWLDDEFSELRYSPLIEATIDALRSLPVEQRMEAMGMERVDDNFFAPDGLAMAIAEDAPIFRETSR
jgi:hypothetical protein